MADVQYTGIEVWRAEFRLRLSFSHNLASRDRAETIIVVVHTAAGTAGYGQALPRSYLTGESMDSVIADIRDLWWPALSGLRIPAGAFRSAVTALTPLYEQADALRKNASYAAVDVAALDAFARESGVPAGWNDAAASAPVPLVGVISGGSPERARWLARIFKWLGYRHFKVKVGRDAAHDEALLSAVRRTVGDGAWLAADANAAWNFDEALERMAGLKHFGLSQIEEPLDAACAALADHAELERRTGLSIMADESLCTEADAQDLLRRGSPSRWNLRLAKNGGFAGVTRLSALARDNGIAVYGGILVGETSLLSAAASAAMPGLGVFAAEYGFPRIFLKNDPFRGGPPGFHGVMALLPEKTRGLGVTLRSDLLTASGQLVWKA